MIEHDAGVYSAPPQLKRIDEPDLGTKVPEQALRIDSRDLARAIPAFRQRCHAKAREHPLVIRIRRRRKLRSN